jgi:hypothetical protein
MSVGAIAGLPPGIYVSTAITPTDFSNFPLVRGSSTRRAVWHEGYAYIFFAEYDPALGEAGDFIYNSSPDGVNWTKPAIGNPVATRAERGDVAWAHQIDVYYDGTYIYVVVGQDMDYGAVIVKRGKPSKGVITWEPWVTVVPPSQDPYWKIYVSMTKTEDGYFWIAYANMNPTNYYSNVYCTRSASPNSISSWLTPVLIYSAAAAGWRNVAVLPVSPSSVYVMYYNYSGAPLYQTRVFGKTFDGYNVGAEESITPLNINNDRAWAAVSDAYKNICVLYQKYGAPNYIYLRRRVGGVWLDPIQTPIVPAPSYYNGFSLTATASDKLYIFFNEEVSDPYFNFYYMTYSPAEGFGGKVLLASSERDSSNYNQEICSNQKLQVGTLIGMWFNTVGPPSPLRVAIVLGLS